MKSVLQDYGSGELKLIESPTPQLRSGYVLVRTLCSVISAGTEKSKVDMGNKGLLAKAKARPDLVKQVITKAKREGLLKTWNTVRDRLSASSSLGYSLAGEIVETACDLDGLHEGQIVACGGSTANHAEIVAVPKNLAVPVPGGVRVEHAAFATLGAIALQGVRQADVRVGERVAVIGLGLIGLLTVQLLKAAGCRVFGIDIAASKEELALQLGCTQTALADDEGLAQKIAEFTSGYGVDATIITASSTSNQPIEQAAEFTREKGRVVVVGLTRMELPREPFYLKELDLRLSRSYGPGRYDKRYEDDGLDYPYAYVRFTERRNMLSFLELVESGQVQLDPLITHRFPIEEAVKAYDLLQGEGREPYLGIVLQYGRKTEDIPRRINLRPRNLDKQKIVVGVIGAGKYATASLLPYLRSHPAISLGAVCTGSGVTAARVADRFDFAAADADADAVIKESDAVIVATQHDNHAAYAIKAITFGKPVFVEKPLAITEAELASVRECVGTAGFDGDSDTRQSPDAARAVSVMVGFNRRFAPATHIVKKHFQSVKSAKHMCIRVNAGPIPADHWIQDRQAGGGRLIGEGCHFVDLAVALSGSLVHSVAASAVRIPGKNPAEWDSFTIGLTMKDGSIATIFYTSIGDVGLPKERIELFAGGKSAVIDDFRRVELWQGGKSKRKSWFTQDKGQREQMNTWVQGMQQGNSPIPLEEIFNVHAACFGALHSIQTGDEVTV
jgi:polar amino acid transport system substrate-binding protein